MPRILVRYASRSGADWTWRTNSSARLRSSVDSFANWESGELRNRLEDSQFSPYRTEVSQVTVGDSGGNPVAVLIREKPARIFARLTPSEGRLIVDRTKLFLALALGALFLLPAAGAQAA